MAAQRDVAGQTALFGSVRLAHGGMGYIECERCVVVEMLVGAVGGVLSYACVDTSPCIVCRHPSLYCV